LPHKRLAVAVSAAFPDLRPDWPLLRDALGSLGVIGTTEVWTDPEVRWSEFDLVLANGAWDNIHRPQEFLAWAEDVAAATLLVNIPPVLRWNLDKRYLSDLSAAGVATVPTVWLAPLAETHFDFPPGEFVVKPTISGGGFETARYHQGEADTARAHVERLLGVGRTVMIQPYQSAIDAQGEVGLIYLAGEFCHAIGKSPLLHLGAGTQSHLWEQQNISAIAPTEAQLATAQAALGAAAHLHGPATYARVDLIPLDDGTPAVLELELLDPALFFEVHPAGALRFAEVLRRLIP
jgi:hypothetical protein